MIDKTLVLFYHTRPGDHFSRTKIGNQTSLERLRDLCPRATFFATYATAPVVLTDLAKLEESRLAYLALAWTSVADRVARSYEIAIALDAALIT